jgi:hypothetical protein
MYIDRFTCQHILCDGDAKNRVRVLARESVEVHQVPVHTIRGQEPLLLARIAEQPQPTEIRATSLQAGGDVREYPTAEALIYKNEASSPLSSRLQHFTGHMLAADHADRDVVLIN